MKRKLSEIKKEEAPLTGKKPKNKIAKRENNKNGYLFVAPYAIVFTIFILIPVILAAVLSFTNFNAIEWPSWV